MNRQKRLARTFLPPLLACVIDVVLELDADLPLVRLVSDKRVFQELICGRPLGVILHQTVLDKVDKLFGPGDRKHIFMIFTFLTAQKENFVSVCFHKTLV